MTKKEMGLWGLSRVTGIWERLRGVIPETRDQWVKIWKDDPDVQKKYSHLVVSTNKPPSASRGVGQPKRIPKKAISLAEDVDSYLTEAAKDNLTKMLPWADDPEFGGMNAI